MRRPMGCDCDGFSCGAAHTHTHFRQQPAGRPAILFLLLSCYYEDVMKMQMLLEGRESCGREFQQENEDGGCVSYWTTDAGFCCCSGSHEIHWPLANY
jgi:hypothetical protein